MNSSKEVWIYGHWLSCNMGDRHQGRGIAKYLQSYLDLPTLARLPLEIQYPRRVVFVNFSTDIKPMSIQMDGIIYPVYGPEHLQDRKPTLIILLTGSIDYMTRFIPHLTHHLDKPSLDQVIIWGGFCHGFKDGIWREGLSLLKHPKIKMWSRSWRDANMYEQWFGRPSRLSGDPMAYWVLSEKPVLEGKDRIVVVSIYAYRYQPEAWKEVIASADRVISIDNVADYPLKKEFPHLEFINDPEVLIPIFRSARCVISGRLHSGLLSALMKIPTAMVVTDNAAPGEGTYKFEAVARTGSGRNNPICSAPLAKDVSTWNPLSNEVLSSDLYLDMTRESLILLRDIVLTQLQV